MVEDLNEAEALEKYISHGKELIMAYISRVQNKRAELVKALDSARLDGETTQGEIAQVEAWIAYNERLLSQLDTISLLFYDLKKSSANLSNSLKKLFINLYRKEHQE